MLSGVRSCTGDYTGGFKNLTSKLYGHLGVFKKTRYMDVLDSEMVINDEENNCRFEEQGKKPGYHATWLIGCQGKVTGVLF